jgi:hypothetical protein
MITLNLRETQGQLKLQIPAPGPPPAATQLAVVKIWWRRHADGSTGAVVAWSDGQYSGMDGSDEPGPVNVEARARPLYRTLAEAFSGVDEDTCRRGHTCSVGCELWREAPAAEPVPTGE